MNKLWKVVCLGDVCGLQNGFAFKSKLFKLSGVPVLRISSIQNDEVCDNRPVFVDPSDYKESLLKYEVHDGDLLIAMSGATTGKVGFNRTGKTFFLNQRVGKFISSDKLNLAYLFLFLLTKVEENLEISAGSAQPNLSTKQIKNFQIPLPPLPEQKRIVAILDEALAGISQAVANAEKNLANARELYLSKKKELFDSLQEKSKNLPLPSVCSDIFAGGDAPKKGLYSKLKTEQYQIPVYANAVKNNGLYGYTDFSRADKPSITIAARGSGTGHIEIRREPFLPIVRLIVIAPDESIINLDYLKHALQNLDISRSGSAIPQLTVPMIKEYSIPTPSLEVQKNVIDELNNLEGCIGQVISVYDKKKILLEELKKAILQKAFMGELTADTVLQQANG